jgi:hypothetical protein
MHCTSVLLSPVDLESHPRRSAFPGRRPALSSSRGFDVQMRSLQPGGVCVTGERSDAAFRKPLRINTCKNDPLIVSLTTLRINTYGSIHSKELDLPLESTLMKNIGGRGGMVNQTCLMHPRSTPSRCRITYLSRRRASTVLLEPANCFPKISTGHISVVSNCVGGCDG